MRAGGGTGKQLADLYALLQMNALMESCFGKSAVSGVMGFAMGGVFGMFMASVRLPLVSPTPLPLRPHTRVCPRVRSIRRCLRDES